LWYNYKCSIFWRRSSTIPRTSMQICCLFLASWEVSHRYKLI
jgi:hypothetical protein